VLAQQREKTAILESSPLDWMTVLFSASCVFYPAKASDIFDVHKASSEKFNVKAPPAGADFYPRKHACQQVANIFYGMI
jgi:hypothetical protein